MTDDCIFCKIVNGDVPAELIAANEHAIAFPDIEPQAPTHILVVPRQHIRDADHLGMAHTQTVGGLFELAHEAAAAKGLSPSRGGGGYRLVFNVGEDASNTVPHLHMHVIGGRSMSWPPG